MRAGPGRLACSLSFLWVLGPGSVLSFINHQACNRRLAKGSQPPTGRAGLASAHRHSTKIGSALSSLGTPCSIRSRQAAGLSPGLPIDDPSNDPPETTRPLPRPPTPAHAVGRTPAGHHTTTRAHSGCPHCPHCPRCPRCQTCRVLKRCNGSGGRVSGRLGAVCVCSVQSASHQFCRVQMTVTPPPTWGISIPAARQLPRRTSPRAPDCPRQGTHTTPAEERESPIPILLFVGLPLTAPITLFSEALAFRLSVLVAFPGHIDPPRSGDDRTALHHATE